MLPLRNLASSTLDRLRPNHYLTLNRIELDRSRLIHNVQVIQNHHPKFDIIPVLKGNAYGHGLIPVGKILNSARCRFLAVDGYFEANRLRGITRHHLIVMGHILPTNVSQLDTKRCSFVVQDTDGLHAFGRLGKPVRIHLELNTGMNRLGLKPGEVAEYLNVLRHYPKLELEGVMTHLADADNDHDDSFTRYQQTVFDDQVESILAAGYTPQLVHIAQTAGSPKVHSRYANAIRLGLGAYGLNPLAQGDHHYAGLQDLKPILELTSTIIKVTDLEKGDKASYNCTFTAPGPMRIGVLPLGYYEGVPRGLSNTGCVTHGGQVLPIRGRVCMNHTLIDLTGTNLGVNDRVTVLSKEPAAPNSILSLQSKHGLFAYTTLTGLSDSVRRETV